MNKSLLYKDLFSLKNNKRKFSVSSSKLSNINEVMKKLSLHQEQMNKFNEELKEKKEKEQKREEEKLQESAAQKAAEDELKQKQERMKEEKSFSDSVEEKYSKWTDKYDKIEDRILDRIEEQSELLGPKKTKEIEDKYADQKNEIAKKSTEKTWALEEEFDNEVKSVAYFQKKVDICAAVLKKFFKYLKNKKKKWMNK